MSIADIRKTAELKMAKSIDSFKNELQKIRTGRAHPGILDQVQVDYYGSMVPISQVANVTLLDARTISVQPWEKGMGQKIEKAIRESDLGLNPATQGDLLRVPMPALTEERRRELTKVVRNAGEDAKIAVRNLRREANDHAKKLLKDKEIPEDDERRSLDEVQKLTDRVIAEIDALIRPRKRRSWPFEDGRELHFAVPAVLNASVDSASRIPRHVAIVMDGNGRWAKKRFMPRFFGHKQGVDALVRTVQACADRGIEYVTVFAFSSENWKRPTEEVSGLMSLVLVAVSKYLAKLAGEGVRIRIVGDRSQVSDKVRAAWDQAEHATRHNTRITLSVAFNYGGGGMWCKPVGRRSRVACRRHRSMKRRSRVSWR